jgi:hypothetical protein
MRREQEETKKEIHEDSLIHIHTNALTYRRECEF